MLFGHLCFPHSTPCLFFNPGRLAASHPAVQFLLVLIVFFFSPVFLSLRSGPRSWYSLDVTRFRFGGVFVWELLGYAMALVLTVPFATELRMAWLRP